MSKHLIIWRAAMFSRFPNPTEGNKYFYGSHYICVKSDGSNTIWRKV